MIKKTMTTLLMLCGTGVGLMSYEPYPHPQKPLLKTIVIDPGHGGFDPGCHGLIAKEKDIALGISLKLG
jgi:N-acetylmuramoyl-L-alanine amidase